MTDKSPRNKTLTVSDDEKRSLQDKAFILDKPIEVEQITNQIVNQDILLALPNLPDAFVDLLVVDPPYNMSKIYSMTKFAKTSGLRYSEWLEEWISEIKRCLKPNASIYVCSEWQSSTEVHQVLQRHFFVRNRITWEREKGRGAKSNWKNCSEDIWFCTVSDDYTFNVEAVKLKRKVIAPYRSADGDPKDWNETEDGNFRLTFPSNLWTDITLPFWSMPENTEHPTQKPEKLVAKLILASSNAGDFVFDPFVGSGTTCVVAKKLDRRFLGIEKEIEYCELALKRLDRADVETSIQGYHDGFFWERNSLALQKTAKKATEPSLSLDSLYDE